LELLDLLYVSAEELSSSEKLLFGNKIFDYSERVDLGSWRILMEGVSFLFILLGFEIFSIKIDL
jgi:hypothetical protein